MVIAAKVVLLLALPSTSGLVVPLPPLDLACLANDAWSTYVHALETAPIASKALTAGTLSLVSDGIVQSREPGPYDRDRALGFALFGCIYTGACQHHIFGFLTSNLDGSVLGLLPLPLPLPQAELDVAMATDLVAALPIPHMPEPTELLAAAERTLVNQCIFIPTLYYPLFFGVTALTRRLTLQQTWDFASEVYLPMLQRNLAFWIPIQFAQFALVPVDLQVLYACVAGLAWNAILSSKAGSVKVSEGDAFAAEGSAVESEPALQRR